MNSFFYALTADFSESFSDFCVIIERFVVHQFVESLLFVVPLYLGKDDFNRVILGRISRVKDGNNAQFRVGSHDFRRLVT